MHPYTTDSNERKIIPLIIVAISITSAWILGKIPIFPWWVDAPSVIGFYSIFYSFFDKYLWKKNIFRKIKLLSIPNLQGSWKGYITSSFDSHAEEYKSDIKIYQNWSSIQIILKTQASKSRSLTATILTKDQDEVLITYEYLNEPLPNAKSTMHTHRGTAMLSLSPDHQKLEGQYYTGRDRQNFGILNFKKLNKNKVR